MKKRIPSQALAPASRPMKLRRRQYQKTDKPKPPAPQIPIRPLDHPPVPPPIMIAPVMPIQQSGITIESILAGQLSPQTKRAYRSDLKAFLAFLGYPDATDKPETFLAVMQSVTRQTAATYRDSLLAEGKSAATVTRRLTALNSVFEIMKEEGVIPRNPLARVKRPKVPNEGKTAALTAEQVERILAQPDVSTPLGKRDRVILGLLFLCGLRRSEVVKIEKADFYMTQGFPLVRVHSKGRADKSDSVLIPTQIWPEIHAFLNECEDGPLFTAQSRNTIYNRHDKPISVNRIFSMFKRYCRLAGIDPAGYSPHSTRASFISLALSGGADVRSVMYAARHSDPSTTIRYDRARMNLADHASNYLKINIPSVNQEDVETEESGSD